MPELNAAIHEMPGLYLCKTCINAPDSQAIGESLTSLHECDLYKFNPLIHSIMNLDAPSLLSINQSKQIHDEIESVKQTSSEIKEMVEQLKANTPQPFLFSQVAGSNAPGRPFGHQAPTAVSTSRPPHLIQAQKRQVEPKHTLVIEKIPNAKQYNNPLDLQTKIRSWDTSLVPMINTAKIVSNGNLFIEAKDESLLQDMTSKLETILSQIGPDVRLRPMVKQGPTANSAIIFNVPSSYTKETITDHAKIELPSITDIVDLKKPNSTATRGPIKVTLTDTREFTHLLSYGLKIG